jgi:hypothetical protein
MMRMAQSRSLFQARLVKQISFIAEKNCANVRQLSTNVNGEYFCLCIFIGSAGTLLMIQKNLLFVNGRILMDARER